MSIPNRLSRWHIYVPLAIVAVLTLIILGCGDDATPTPTPTTVVPQATATPTNPPRPTATLAPTPTIAPGETRQPTPMPTSTATAGPRPTPTPTATAEPRPTPTPTATARPRPTPTPTTQAPRELVSPRLKISMIPPAVQTTLPYETIISAGAPLNLMYNHLLFDNQLDSSKEPMLATDWNMSPDGKNWTFKLRQGVPFHNGDEFTAEDVIGSYKINMILVTSRAGSTQEFYEKLGGTPEGTLDANNGSENIETVNDHEIIFHAQSPFINLALNVTEGNSFMHIYNAGHFNEVGEEGFRVDPVSTGPFKFVDLKINQFILYERFKNPGDDHWWQIPDFEEVQIFYVPEGATRAAMILTEETHIADIPPLLVEEATSRGMKVSVSTLPGLELFTSFGGVYFPGDPGYNPENPFLIKEVRAAVNHGIDRDLLQETFFGTRALQGTAGLVNPRFTFHKDEWTPYEYNPALARQLLADAGYPNGLGLEWWVGNNMGGVPEGPDLVEAMAAMLEEVGFDVDIKATEFSASLGQMTNPETSSFQGANPKGKLFTWRQGAHADKVHTYPTRRYLPRGGGYVIYQDEFTNGWLDEYSVAVPDDEVTRLLQEWGDHAYDNFTSVPMFWISPLIVFNPNVLVDYQANHKNFGPVRALEFVQAVFK